MTARHRIELLLFAAAFLAFAYFNQGGGWNQNARFAEVRAIVEEGRFAIDHYLIYERNEAGTELVRRPVDRAEFERNGARYRLCWVDMNWSFTPVGEHPMAPGTEQAAMVEYCASGDIGYVPQTGHFHPNKPPGTAFLAVPAYAAILGVERLLGISPDGWWTLGMNAWLTSVFSVGLLAAIGTVLFFRMAVEFADGALLPALGATVAFAFGTTFWPFATFLIDHALTASLLVAAFYCTRVAAKSASPLPLVLAGLCAGLAVLTNYVAVGAVGLLGLYVLLGQTSWAWRRALWFSLGGLGPFLLLCWYGYTCFGSPFRPSTDFQNPLFSDHKAILGMFAIPQTSLEMFRLLDIALLLTVSPFRGLFFFCPVLLLGLWGALRWMGEKRWVPEARLCLGVFAFFFVVNVTFNGFHAGFTAGPRYLVPGIPFLALPLVVAFARTPRLTGALTAISVAIALIFTATDAQNPVGIGGHARVEGKRVEWSYHLLADYAWPLLAHERAWPLLLEQMDLQVEKEYAGWDNEGLGHEERAKREQALRQQLLGSIARAEPSPFLLASIEGPVSVNPVGVWEGLLDYGTFLPGTPQTRWASFNVGELMWPQSRWSLVPLLVALAGLLGAAWRVALRERKVVILRNLAAQ